jgi:hypothetical protein
MTQLIVNGLPAIAMRLTVPWSGPWVAEVDLPDVADVGDAVVMTFGETTLRGTVIVEQSGVFALQRKFTCVGGAGGWRKELPAKGYHSDAGVSAALVVADLAREAGETVGTFAPTNRVGVDYVRARALASVTLGDVVGTDWHVDFAGVTQVTARSIVDAKHDVLTVDVLGRQATLHVQDFGAVQIGHSITDERAAEPIVVREINVDISGAGLRVTVDTAPERLTTALRALIPPSKLFGLYKYRVFRMSADRAELQSATPSKGLPDILPAAMWPGLPGAHAKLAPGAEVLVQFIDGDRAQPVVTHFVGRGGPGHSPTKLELGGATGAEAARKGDVVTVVLPPLVFVGTIGGAPATGVCTATLPQVTGTITAGSGKVSIA